MSTLILILIGFVVLTLLLVALCVVSMWMLFTKAGVPGWASIVPFYSNVKMIEIVNKPLWWVMLSFVPFVNIVIFVILVRRLAGVFGKGAWFTVGMIFLPFIFYPILAFGSAQYKNTYPPAKPMSEATKWSLIAAFFVMLYWGVMFTAGFSNTGVKPLSIINSATGGYATDGIYVYLNDNVISGAQASSFRMVGDTDYAVDNWSVYYGGTLIPGQSSEDFKVLHDTVYAKGSENAYYAGKVIPMADVSSFTALDSIFAKDSSEVYADGSPISADPASFMSSSPNSGYGQDTQHVYYDGTVVSGADPASFMVESGYLGSTISYDAKDKKHYYNAGEVVK